MEPVPDHTGIGKSIFYAREYFLQGVNAKKDKESSA